MADVAAPPAPVRRPSRRGPHAPRALAGAAVRMPRSAEAVRKAFRRPADWQDDTWDYFDVVPEVKHLVWWVSNLLSLVDLYPAVELPDGAVVPVDAINPDTIETDDAGVVTNPGIRMSANVLDDATAERAAAEWARLRSGLGDQGELQKNLAANLEVAAECYLVGYGEREAVPADPIRGLDEVPAQPERWEIRSVSEVYEHDGKWHVRSEPGRDGAALDAGPGGRDDVIRLYQQHPRYKALPDCNLRGTIEELRLLQVLNGQMYAEHASKASAGGFTWPKGLTIRKSKPGPEPDEGVEPEGGDEITESDMQDVVDALTNPGHDPMDINSVAPFFIVGEKELLVPDVLRRIDFSRHTGEELDKRIEGRVERFAHGVAAPVEVVLGHRNTTFANAEQIDENEFDDYLQPRVVLMCDVLTEGFLHPQMLAPPASVPGAPVPSVGLQVDQVAKVFVWYDPTPIIGNPDLSEAADSALDRFAVSREGYRRMRQIPEEYAPDEAEQLAVFALRRGIAAAEVTATLLERIDPSFVAPALPAAGGGGFPPGDEGAGDAAAIAASARAFIVRQRVLAELGAQLLGLDPATLPALGMGAPPGPPARAREG